MKSIRIVPLVLVVVSSALAAGCAVQSPSFLNSAAFNASHFEPPSCRNMRRAITTAVANAEVGDAQARPISGFDYLKVDRFAAHFAPKFKRRASRPAFRAWVARLRKLDDEAIRTELANLPARDHRALGVQLFGRKTTRAKIHAAYDACAANYVAQLLATPPRKAQLVAAARVGDDYSDLAQAVGIYPLTSIPVAEGWKQWKKKHLGSFDQPLSALPVHGRLAEWAPSATQKPASYPEIRSIIERSTDPVLGIPQPTGRDLQRLLHAFAPVWQVDVTGTYDRIGYPTWRNKGQSIVINDRRPVTFTRLSHAVIDNQVLLQLNYSIWFQERPRKGPLDLLGGKLDGLIWRVTLSPNGRPVIYDTIHACGCYHFLFPVEPTETAKWRGRNRNLKELPAILKGGKVPAPGQRIVLRLATETHYLLNLELITAASSGVSSTTYRMVDDNALRSLPLSRHTRRSLYRPDGLVANTERLERYLLWPTGVKSPGAVRQWGRHAIAFAERRHFDDPILLDRIFGK